MDVQKIENYLDTIEGLCAKIRREIGDGKPRVRITTNQTDSRVVVRHGDKIIAGTPRIPQISQYSVEQTIDFAESIINDPNWPVAVNVDLLCEPTDDDLTIRADTVLEQMIDCRMKDLKFLDYGCGLGYTAARSLLGSNAPREAVGYDVKREDWGRFRGMSDLIFTDNYNDLEKGSFDVILMYDVLDHCERPVEALMNVKKLLSKDGVVYLRCHPWASRTGGHLYRQINKAYIHLAIDDNILREMGYEVEPVKKVLRPLKTYKEWFTAAGFKVCRENSDTHDVLERSLKDNTLIKRHWLSEQARDHTLTDEKVNQILEIHFVDYILKGS